MKKKTNKKNELKVKVIKPKKMDLEKAKYKMTHGGMSANEWSAMNGITTICFG